MSQFRAAEAAMKRDGFVPIQEFADLHNVSGACVRNWVQTRMLSTDDVKRFGHCFGVKPNAEIKATKVPWRLERYGPTGRNYGLYLPASVHGVDGSVSDSAG